MKRKKHDPDRRRWSARLPMLGVGLVVVAYVATIMTHLMAR
ncbi:hypothetical protein [Ornithinimicrobium panacihumi]